VTLDLLRARPQPRFLHVYTREPDHRQHRYWKWLQPQYYLGVDDADVARFGDVIPQLYERLDAFLGEILALVGRDTVVVVASDHGHSPTMLHPKLYSHHQHGPPGVLLMAGGPIVAGRRVEGASIFDLMPTLLHLLGLPVPDDAAGRVLDEALDPAFAAAHPVRRVASYDGLAGRIRRADGGGAAAHDQEEVRRLRALGYVE
jgi:arylsulfatase A-like enzyme